MSHPWQRGSLHNSQEYCQRRLVVINYELDVGLIGGLGSVNIIEGCSDAVESVAVGADATKVTPVVEYHQHELRSVLLVGDIPIEKATKGKQGEDASPEHYASLQMWQWYRGEDAV